jgi:hypothetical protein
MANYHARQRRSAPDQVVIVAKRFKRGFQIAKKPLGFLCVQALIQKRDYERPLARNELFGLLDGLFGPFQISLRRQRTPGRGP